MLLIISLASCSSYNVSNEGSEADVKKFEKVALLNVFIFPPYEVIPAIIDKPLYSSLYEILPEVEELHKQYADTIQTYMGKTLRETSGMQVLYGKDLYDKLPSRVLDSLGIKTFSTKLRENYFFPKLQLPANTLNFSDFFYQQGPNLYETSRELSHKNKVFSKLCDYLQVDGIIVAFIRSVTVDFGLVTDDVARKLITKIIYYDNKGKNILTSIVYSEELAEQGNDIVFYKEVIDLNYRYIDAYFRNFFGDESFDNVLEEYKLISD